MLGCHYIHNGTYRRTRAEIPKFLAKSPKYQINDNSHVTLFYVSVSFLRFNDNPHNNLK